VISSCQAFAFKLNLCRYAACAAAAGTNFGKAGGGCATNNDGWDRVALSTPG
jgi:hypothetical protein